MTNLKNRVVLALVLPFTSCSVKENTSALRNESDFVSPPVKFNSISFTEVRKDSPAKGLIAEIKDEQVKSYRAILNDSALNPTDIKAMLATASDVNCVEPNIIALSKAISEAPAALRPELDLLRKRFLWKELTIDSSISLHQSFGDPKKHLRISFDAIADGKHVVTSISPTARLKDRVEREDPCSLSSDAVTRELARFIGDSIARALLETGRYNESVLEDTLGRKFYVKSATSGTDPRFKIRFGTAESSVTSLPLKDNVAIFHVERIDGTNLVGTLEIPKLKTENLLDSGSGWEHNRTGPVPSIYRSCEGAHKNHVLTFHQLGPEI